MRAIGVSHTACKDEFRRNLRSHSWSVFSFFIIFLFKFRITRPYIIHKLEVSPVVLRPTSSPLFSTCYTLSKYHCTVSVVGRPLLLFGCNAIIGKFRRLPFGCLLPISLTVPTYLSACNIRALTQQRNQNAPRRDAAQFPLARRPTPREYTIVIPYSLYM